MAGATKNCPMLSGNCPRCGQITTTFDIEAATLVDTLNYYFEITVVCRKCGRPSLARVRNDLNSTSPLEFGPQFIDGFIQFHEWVFTVPNTRICPDHVPTPIQRIFDEAAKCAAIGTWDASGAMYRKVLDAATRTLVPLPEDGDSATPSWKIYKDLRLRLDWLFERGLLNASLKELSSCIHQDGNDAAHDLEGIGKSEAEDLADFTEIALETLYTVPGQIAENQRRREERRGNT